MHKMAAITKKKKEVSFFCKKVGHYKKECCFFKKMHEKSSSIKDNLVAIISEINMVEDNESSEWTLVQLVMCVKTKITLRHPRKKMGTCSTWEMLQVSKSMAKGL